MAGERASAAVVTATQDRGVDAAATRSDPGRDQRALRACLLADLAGEILGHRRLVEDRVVAQVRELILQLQQTGVLRTLARIGFRRRRLRLLDLLLRLRLLLLDLGRRRWRRRRLLERQLDDAVGKLRRLHLVALAHRQQRDQDREHREDDERVAHHFAKTPLDFLGRRPGQVVQAIKRSEYHGGYTCLT